MTPTDAASRLAGLLVAAAGAVLVWDALATPAAGLGLVPLAPGGIATPPALVAAVGVAFVLAGLAALLDRARWLAVSVGGLALAAVVALLVAGGDSPPVVLGVGVVAVATLLAGASIDRRPA